MHLIHPIYLDVPMLVSFAAAIQGGVSFESEITKEQEASKSGSGKAVGKFGLSKLFGSLFEAEIDAELNGVVSNKGSSTSKESKLHTEASIAILLYNEFLKDKSLLQQISSTERISHITPGALVEVAGTIEKNAVDTVVDYIEAISILSELGSKPQISSSRRNSNSNSTKSQPNELM